MALSLSQDGAKPHTLLGTGHNDLSCRYVVCRHTPALEREVAPILNEDLLQGCEEALAQFLDWSALTEFFLFFF